MKLIWYYLNKWFISKKKMKKKTYISVFKDHSSIENGRKIKHYWIEITPVLDRFVEMALSEVFFVPMPFETWHWSVLH